MLPPRGAVISAPVRAWLHSAGLADPEPAYENVSLAFGCEVLRASDTVWFISEGVTRPKVETGTLVILPLHNELPGGPAGVSQRAGGGRGPALVGAMPAALAAAAA